MWKNLNEIISEIKNVNSNLESNINKLLEEKNKMKEYNRLLEKNILELNNENKELKSNIWFQKNDNEVKLSDKIFNFLFILFFVILLYFPFTILLLHNHYYFNTYISMIEINNKDIFSFLIWPLFMWLIIFFLTKVDEIDLKWNTSWLRLYISFFIIFILFFILTYIFMFELNLNTLLWN